MSNYVNAVDRVAILQTRLAALAVPVVVAAPVIRGNAGQGTSLTATPGVWDHNPTTYAYTWKSAATTVGTNSPTYALAAGDATKAMTCQVVATNAFGASTAATSNAITAP